MGVEILCGKLQNIVVVDVHATWRFALVFAGAIMVALVVIELVGFRPRSVRSDAHVVRPLRWTHHSRASLRTKQEKCQKKKLNEINVKVKVQHRKITQTRKNDSPPVKEAAETEASDGCQLQLVAEDGAVLAVER
jgi:hypothetical protein